MLATSAGGCSHTPAVDTDLARAVLNIHFACLLPEDNQSAQLCLTNLIVKSNTAQADATSCLWQICTFGTSCASATATRTFGQCCISRKEPSGHAQGLLRQAAYNTSNVYIPDPALLCRQQCLCLESALHPRTQLAGPPHRSATQRWLGPALSAGPGLQPLQPQCLQSR